MPTEVHTHTHQKVHKNVDNSPWDRLEATQPFMNNRTDKQIVLYSQNEMLCNYKNGGTTYNNIDKISQT